MNAKIIAIVVIFIDNFRLCQSVTYDNYSLYNVIPTDKAHLKFLEKIDHRRYMDVIFWNQPFKLHESVQLIVNPIDENLFLERAQHHNLETRLLLKDVQSAFDDQSVRKYFRLRVNSFSWDTYHSLEDVYQWLTDLALKFDTILNLNSIGKSTEGREIFAVTVKKGHPKLKVVVEGGINGNEWISVEFVTFLLDQLLRSNSTGDKRLEPLLDMYEWNLIPVVNPDGYLYSQRMDRLWRKNRRALGGNNFGVDLDRNFDYQFGKYGTSDDEINPYYCGPHAFSEPEARALSKYVAANKNAIKFYFAFHGYGQKLFIPYIDGIKLLDNYGEAEDFGRQAAQKIYNVHKVKYKVENLYDRKLVQESRSQLVLEIESSLGRTSEWGARNLVRLNTMKTKVCTFTAKKGPFVVSSKFQGVTLHLPKSVKLLGVDISGQLQFGGLRYSGNSASYLKRYNRIRFVYVIYLRDNGTYGHALPPVQIMPSCKEALTGLIQLMTAKHHKMKVRLFNHGHQSRVTNFLIIFTYIHICCIFIF